MFKYVCISLVVPSENTAVGEPAILCDHFVFTLSWCLAHLLNIILIIFWKPLRKGGRTVPFGRR